MVKANFISILEKPQQIHHQNMMELKTVIQEHPYFQAARALYLKTLKNEESFRYNNELKITAAHTKDRSVLFDFITSELFQNDEEKQDTTKETVLLEKKDTAEETILENTSNQQTTEESIINTEENTITEVEQASQELAIGRPLQFNKKETHSFSQWLQLSNEKTITRKEESDTEKTEKEILIDKFIASNPKISPVDKNNPISIKINENKERPQLMTETLAKVYLEQKKYESAIKAYEILSLKYPEKSGFFADQIKQIQILQKHK